MTKTTNFETSIFVEITYVRSKIFYSAILEEELLGHTLKKEK